MLLHIQHAHDHPVLENPNHVQLLPVFVGFLFCKAGEAEGEDVTITESFWSAWTFISDPGTHADVVSITLPSSCKYA